MARPIEPTPTLRGKDAVNFLNEKKRIESLKPTDRNFLNEKKRIESLKPTDREYKHREAFFNECIEITKKYKPVRI